MDGQEMKKQVILYSWVKQVSSAGSPMR